MFCSVCLLYLVLLGSVPLALLCSVFVLFLYCLGSGLFCLVMFGSVLFCFVLFCAVLYCSVLPCYVPIALLCSDLVYCVCFLFCVFC